MTPIRSIVKFVQNGYLQVLDIEQYRDMIYLKPVYETHYPVKSKHSKPYNGTRF